MEATLSYKAAFFIKNLPVCERGLRLALGGGLAVAGIAYGGTLGLVGAASGIILALTGVFGFCPMCAMVGRRLPGKS